MQRPSVVKLIAAMTLVIAIAAAKQPTELEVFSEKTKKYSQLHKQLKGKLPDLKDKSQPALIEAMEKGLQASLQKARWNAKQGDILSPEMRPILLAIVKTELKGAENTPARQTVKVGNPRTGDEKKPVVLKVNAAYGKDAPLSTVPASLLKRLPPLPEELEYRFVGKHMILRDTTANMIVDYMLDVTP